MPLESNITPSQKLQDLLPIGDIIPPILKDCIWRAYASGSITIDEAATFIAEMGDQKS